MINVDNITIQFSQVLDTGEDQTLIVDHDGETASMSTDAWTLGNVTLTDMIEIADTCHATARLTITAIREGMR
ncbi:MAG TPA: hypothetical protein VLA24_05445 [Pseudomonadales bacterium]|nr:hypothetical protein [Pseudomonadales bacterium]